MSTRTLTKRWARLHEAAAYTGLTQQTLRNYAKAGLIRLRHVRTQGASKGVTLVDLVELDKAIEDASGCPAVLAVNTPQKGDEQ
ncbi:MAG TPA: hypothetical protein VG796_01230 [Verrucomicrobiales bacterium]|nr:hypothetical protein [Verrucomicrobiales bacterium]